MSAHIPGPWDAIEIPNGWVIQRGEGKGNDYIADVHGHVGDPVSDAANAHLIAAAPDLLQALKGLVRAWERFAPGPLTTLNGGPSSYDKAVAAIAKAEGRS